MRSKLFVAAAIATTLAGALAVASPAEARWRGHGGYHHGGGWRGGGAVIGGLAAGALIGGALASSSYGYGYGPAYGYGYGGPVYASPGGGEVEYCMRRFK